MNKILVFIILFFCFFFYVSANEKTKIIIDTDGGADDLRAISLILSSNKFEVEAITTSDGVLSPEMTFKKVRNLLCSLNFQGIPTACGRKTILSPCFCRKINEKICWGDSCIFPDPKFFSSSALIGQILNETSTPVMFFAMGSLTSLS